MKTRLFLGFTKLNEVVFADIDNREGTFSACFDSSYPMAIGDNEINERIEDMIEQMDSDYILNRLQQYDCRPSELAENLLMDCYNPIEEFFDNSLYPEMYTIDRIEDDIYFLASGCGQHDTRGEMAWCVNAELYNYIHELWDEYHLKKIPTEKFEELMSAIEHQNNTINEELIIKNWLEKNYGI